MSLCCLKIPIEIDHFFVFKMFSLLYSLSSRRNNVGFYSVRHFFNKLEFDLFECSKGMFVLRRFQRLPKRNKGF